MSLYENFSKTTHGRINYNSSTGTFDPYTLNSKRRWKEIGNEKGIKKWMDIGLFGISFLTQFQVYRDFYTSGTDLSRVKKLQKQEPASPASPKLAGLQKDIRRQRPGELRLMTATVVNLVEGFPVYNGLMRMAKVLKASFQQEQRLLRSGLREELLELRRQQTLLDTLRPVHSTDCGICYGENGNIAHCLSTGGGLAENPGTFHIECLEQTRQTQLNVAFRSNDPMVKLNLGKKYSSLVTMPCPQCSQPIFSEDRLLDTGVREFPDLARRYPIHKSFPRYVGEEFVVKPMSKAVVNLSRMGEGLLRRGVAYMPVEQELEMGNLHLD